MAAVPIAPGRYACPACPGRFEPLGEKKRHLKSTHPSKPSGPKNGAS